MLTIPVVSQEVFRQLYFNKKTEKRKEVLIKNAGFFRIMQYYKPVCSAVSMVLCACINSLSFPILGLLISFY